MPAIAANPEALATLWRRVRTLALSLTRPRAPEALPVSIDRRRVYVLPTRFGLFYSTLLLGMYRRLRRDVAERDLVLVFVDDVCRDLAPDDLVEESVCHRFFS